MDRGSIDEAEAEAGAAVLEAAPDRPPAIGRDERRMHVRAYNRWTSLLSGRAFPTLDDLDFTAEDDLGPHSVVIDFRGDVEDPAIAFIGDALRAEGGHEIDIRRLSDVPRRSLLSRLTSHHLEIIANRAPIGFEAEFVNRRAKLAMYRGILLPLASDGETIDHVWGVINWKEAVDPGLQAGLAAEVAGALASQPARRPAVPIWADGPGRARRPMPVAAAEPVAASPVDPLAERLAAARAVAEAARGADQRTRAALYQALSLAYDFALAVEAQPHGYAGLLAEAGIRAQARAPMTPITKLVFGADYDRTRLTEFAAVMMYARREQVAAGGLRPLLERQPGGLKALVAAERRARRPAASKTDPAHPLRTAPALATVVLDGGDAEFVVLLARRDEAGHAIVAVLDDVPLTARALRLAR